MHGWPGSVVEFLDVIPRLTQPEAHGGDSADAFHVVAPSLPGYGFSEPPRTRGWDVWRIARAFIELMQRLDYGRYAAQGGDWGAQIATRIGALDPEHCAAIHLNMPVAERPDEPVPLTEDDTADLAAMQRFQRDEAAYAHEQATKPQTLGVALNDSPAGLLAWILEKFRAWSDCAGNLENVFTRDQLLTNVMLYWVTSTITSSARLVLGAPTRRVSGRFAGVRRRADRDRALSQRGRAISAHMGRASLQRGALGRNATGGPLRGDGAAQPLRGRRAELLPYASVRTPPHVERPRSLHGLLRTILSIGSNLRSRALPRV